MEFSKLRKQGYYGLSTSKLFLSSRRCLGKVPDTHNHTLKIISPWQDETTVACVDAFELLFGWLVCRRFGDVWCLASVEVNYDNSHIADGL
jgi:hypothetical protein